PVGSRQLSVPLSPATSLHPAWPPPEKPARGRDSSEQGPANTRPLRPPRNSSRHSALSQSCEISGRRDVLGIVTVVYDDVYLRVFRRKSRHEAFNADNSQNYPDPILFRRSSGIRTVRKQFRREIGR